MKQTKELLDVLKGLQNDDYTQDLPDFVKTGNDRFEWQDFVSFSTGDL